ncbi:MAG: cysteine--tRNA ligase, partial [Chitinophagaceae bacterium]
IAQSTICNHVPPVRYWMHNNMITINGRKMGKSYNNVIKLTELFSGNHPELEKAYAPMTVRFFILQTHYRSTLDFSNDALQAAEKGLKRLMEPYAWFQALALPASGEAADSELDKKIRGLLAELHEFMSDDFNTARVLASLFEIVPVMNSFKDKVLPVDSLSAETLALLKSELKLFVEDILGLRQEDDAASGKLKTVIDILIDLRKEARANKDWKTSDRIRNQLAEAGIQLKDEKDGGMSWSLS